jgi:phosphatidylinositol 4-phosphatase
MKKHIFDLNNNYGSAILINLIDKKGDQLELGNAYNNIYNSIVFDFEPNNKPEFIWFDFHHNCRGMKYENLDILLSSEIFKKFLKEKEYFHAEIPSFYNNMKKFNKKNFAEKAIQILSIQKGVFRTNCIDCLDRTNIVQTLISRHLTHQIMLKFNICTKKSYSGKVFQKFRTNFEKDFKNFWSNHGDVLSYSYSGTQAQKSDFTRTGKRTYFGVFKDMIIGTKRFFVNNINDFYYQECQDLFLNKIPIKNMRYLSKPSKKIFHSLTILTLSYLIYWLSKLIKTAHTKKP